MSQHFKRVFLRAPIKTFGLYQDDEHVFKAKLVNISEGGLLLEGLPHFPEVPGIPLLLDLPDIPDLLAMSASEVMALRPENFKRSIIRIKARLIRRYDQKSEVDDIFMTKIGCEFVKVDENEKVIIREYVLRFTKNIVYLLNQFEAGKKDPELLRKTAELLGYRDEKRISFLRQKVLHDYQSLESL